MSQRLILCSFARRNHGPSAPPNAGTERLVMALRTASLSCTAVIGCWCYLQTWTTTRAGSCSLPRFKTVVLPRAIMVIKLSACRFFLRFPSDHRCFLIAMQARHDIHRCLREVTRAVGLCMPRVVGVRPLPHCARRYWLSRGIVVAES